MQVNRIAGTIAIVSAFTFVGCYTIDAPTPPVNWTREMAKQIPALGNSILASPLVREARAPILLKIGGMLDKTRFTIDTELLMKKMRTHLVNNGGARVIVFDNDADVIEFCRVRQRKRMHEALKGELKYIAERILRSALFRGRNSKVVVVNPNVASNLKGLNADGLISLLRDEIIAASSGNVTFLSSGKAQDADWLLKSDFTAFSMTDEAADGNRQPNADLNLRVMFESPVTGESQFEVSVPVSRKLFDFSLDATFILSGELNVMTNETSAMTDDYVRMGFNIIDPDTTLHRWEGACEVSVTTHKSILYQ